MMPLPLTAIALCMALGPFIAAAQTARPSPADAEAAARALAGSAPSAELRAAASRFLELAEIRRAAEAGLNTRGDARLAQDLDAAQQRNTGEVRDAVQRLPSRYHDTSFRCLEDAETCSRSGVPALLCAGTMMVCLASRILGRG